MQFPCSARQQSNTITDAGLWETMTKQDKPKKNNNL